MKGTPAKVFYIMVLALLPFALATIISNWQSIRVTEQEKAELMAAATRQNAVHLASDIASIQTTQSLTATVLATGADPGVCQRMQRVFRAMSGGDGIETVIFDRQGRIECQTHDGAKLAQGAQTHAYDEGGLALAPDLDGMLIRSASRDGALTAYSLYRRPALALLTGGGNRDPDQSIALRQGGAQLILVGARPARTLDRAGGLATRAQVGENDLEFIMAVNGKGTKTRTVSLLMPLVLWIAAAFFGWLVVRWTLIEPLIDLQREVADYTPGMVMHPPPMAKLASGEIVALGDAFHEMSKDVAEHEEEMRQALSRQMQLTREVHHRVKNNLQIISSLISLHWRASSDPDTTGCYLSIQRRVDALSVVQRNHYAELDEERGVRARPMMNEIASALKTSAQVQGGVNLDIAVNCEDYYLHQDVAAPIAFMTAELADLVIALETGGQLNISLEAEPDTPGKARFSLASPAFRRAKPSDTGKVELYERVLSGLARQLRTPLGHDVERGEYHIFVPVAV